MGRVHRLLRSERSCARDYGADPNGGPPDARPLLAVPWRSRASHLWVLCCEPDVRHLLLLGVDLRHSIRGGGLRDPLGHGEALASCRRRHSSAAFERLSGVRTTKATGSALASRSDAAATGFARHHSPCDSWHRLRREEPRPPFLPGVRQVVTTSGALLPAMRCARSSLPGGGSPLTGEEMYCDSCGQPLAETPNRMRQGDVR